MREYHDVRMGPQVYPIGLAKTWIQARGGVVAAPGDPGIQGLTGAWQIDCPQTSTPLDGLDATDGLAGGAGGAGGNGGGGRNSLGGDGRAGGRTGAPGSDRSPIQNPNCGQLGKVGPVGAEGVLSPNKMPDSICWSGVSQYQIYLPLARM